MPVPLADAERSRRKYFYVIPVIQLDLPGHKLEPVRSFVYADVLTRKAKSQAPSDSLHAMEPLLAPWLYSIISIYSCQSYQTILRYVCLDVARRVLHFLRNTQVVVHRFELLRSVIAVLLECFAFGSRLSFFLCQEKRDGLRYLAFLFRGSRSPFVRSRGTLRLSAFVGSLRVWPFLYGDLDGSAGDARTGLAARPLCAFT